jgi:hypothetical protein
VAKRRLLLCSFHHLAAGNAAILQVTATRFAALFPTAETGTLTEFSDRQSRICPAATPAKLASVSNIYRRSSQC